MYCDSRIAATVDTESSMLSKSVKYIMIPIGLIKHWFNKSV